MPGGVYRRGFLVNLIFSFLKGSSQFRDQWPTIRKRQAIA